MNNQDGCMAMLYAIGLGFFLGAIAEWTYIKREAVKNGAAEWRMDKFGNRSIHWREAE